MLNIRHWFTVGTPDHKQDVFPNDNAYKLEVFVPIISDIEEQAIVSAFQVNISPNPATNYFQIYSKSQYPIVAYTIYELSGKIRLPSRVGKGFSHQVDGQDLTNGLYLIAVELSDGKSHITKLVIQK